MIPEKAVKSKKSTSSKPACGLEFLAESVGFEPTCPVKDNCISSAARYDRFDNSPCLSSDLSILAENDAQCKPPLEKVLK